MSVENAKAYMLRMREDEAFRKRVNERPTNEDAWTFLKAEGYEFSIEDFKTAQDEMVKEVGFSIGQMK